MRRVEPLSRTDHDREAFDCGDAELNAFLQKHAARQADRGVSRTFVLVDDLDPPPRPIVAYFTFRPYEIAADALPGGMTGGYTRTVGAYLLAKLAVAHRFQRSGVGTRLLHEIFCRVIALIDQGGGAGLFADAKNAGIVPYYEARGFTRLGPESLKLFIPKQNIARIIGEVRPRGAEPRE